MSLYARAVNESLKKGQDHRDGRTIFSHIRNQPYFSESPRHANHRLIGLLLVTAPSGAMGYMVSTDENGDAAGNYTVIARKRRLMDGKRNEFVMVPIGRFLMPSNSAHIPVCQRRPCPTPSLAL